MAISVEFANVGVFGKRESSSRQPRQPGWREIRSGHPSTGAGLVKSTVKLLLSEASVCRDTALLWRDLLYGR